MRPVHEAGGLAIIKTVSDLLMLAGRGLTDESLDGNDIAFAARAIANKRSSSDKYSYSSVAKSAAKLQAIFPIIASRGISVESINRVRKYIERQACMMLQLALQQANISSAKNGIEYLKTFHQNLQVGSNGLDALGDVLNTYADTINNESTSSYSNFKLNEIIEEAMYEALCSPINFESDDSITLDSSQVNEILEMFNNSESYTVYDTKLNPVSIGDYKVNESYNNKYTVELKSLYEAKGANGNRGNSTNNNNNKDPKVVRYNNVEIKNDYVKKINSDLPSLIIVRFYSKETRDVATEFIVGVKAKVIPCNSDEILRRIANDNKDGKFFINLLRTLTGELKKSDFLFGLSRTYEDLASTKKKGAQGDIWALLKNRAFASKEAVRRGAGNNYSAITTVVITRDDADDLFKEENIDVTNVKVAKRFLESYNLLAFVIIDDSIESMKVLMDDGGNAFEEFSYQYLEKESSDGNYKKLINLIANQR